MLSPCLVAHSLAAAIPTLVPQELQALVADAWDDIHDMRHDSWTRHDTIWHVSLMVLQGFQNNIGLDYATTTYKGPTFHVSGSARHHSSTTAHMYVFCISQCRLMFTMTILTILTKCHLTGSDRRCIRIPVVRPRWWTPHSEKNCWQKHELRTWCKAACFWMKN